MSTRRARESATAKGDGGVKSMGFLLSFFSSVNNGYALSKTFMEFARSIIKLASEEIEEKWRRTPGSTTSTELSSPLISPPIYTPRGLSMKRSLQRFLQKRKHRIEATSPYHH
ncbi:jasmonate-zim-domain protein 8 [Artemisia annua]|uniref:Jasmonate-zim-domain protein 8 n=1 Tax=Artemisia annua TaxID=35608 RepID=A0A2U1Q169_ARTAN|nr:jasmonate-zim-domain protein 8 [Artemisia annua]